MPAVVTNVMKTTLSISTLSPEVQCLLHDRSGVSMGVKFPSLESFLRISATTEGQELRLSGFAVFSKLANACQPLVDVNKSSIQVNKVALISLKDDVDDAVCPFRKLTTNAQNARYSVVILSLKIEIYLDPIYSSFAKHITERFIIHFLIGSNIIRLSHDLTTHFLGKVPMTSYTSLMTNGAYQLCRSLYGRILTTILISGNN